MPELIQFKNGCQIKNLYAADGKKLSSRYVTLVPGIFNPLNPGQVIDGLDVNENDFVTIEGMDYINNIEYKVSRIFDWDVSFEPKDNISIKRVHNGEGYAEGVAYVTEGNEPAYSYYRPDHLGNNREVWCASYIRNYSVRPEKTMQRTQYYPSGLPWAESTGTSMQPYKHNGKEFIETHGYDVTDHGNRGIHHATNRYTTMDRFAEKFPWQSPYVHANNNPITYVDVGGNQAIHHSQSRIIAQYGQIRVKLENLHNFTRNQILSFANNPSNWKSGEIGVSMEVAHLRYQSVPLPASEIATMDNTHGAATGNPTEHSVQNPTTKSSNYTQTDKRYNTQTVSGASGTTKVAAKGMLALDVLIFGAQLGGTLSVYDDLNKIQKHLGVLQSTIDMVNTAASNGLIPEQYQTQTSMLDILNVVYQGQNTTKDRNIMNIGIQILIENNMYDPDKIK